MDTSEIFVKMVMDRWNTLFVNTSALIDQLSDESLKREISKTKNRGIYVLGHLIAVHDDMIVLMDLG